MLCYLCHTHGLTALKEQEVQTLSEGYINVSYLGVTDAAPTRQVQAADDVHGQHCLTL